MDDSNFTCYDDGVGVDLLTSYNCNYETLHIILYIYIYTLIQIRKMCKLDKVMCTLVENL